MKRFSAGDIVLKALGLLLLTAAVLKGHELLTVPVANKNLWTWRPFLIFQVEFELALGIWLLSGIFRRLAWLAALACFSLFCCVTLYKGLTGAASCGCFGKIHVNPWITLMAIDFPAVISLSVFRPAHAFDAFLSFLRKQESMFHGIGEYVEPLPSWPRFGAAASLGLLLLGTTTPILALNKPASVTSTYEVLEPQTWVGKKLPILKDIDAGAQLAAGNWLVVLYHRDCPDCMVAIPKYKQMALDLRQSDTFLRIVLVEIPPYAQGTRHDDEGLCLWRRLNGTKQWFVTTPAVALVSDGDVRYAWEEGMAPDLEAVLTSATNPLR